MSPKHSEPSHDQSRRDSKTGASVWARAPYNFVRLPERVVTVEPPPDQSVYSGNTGWIDCEMMTCAPTYIRGMVTPEWLKQQDAVQKAEAERERAWQKEQRRSSPEDRAAIEAHEQKLKQQSAAFFGMNGIPFLPGSSLRGMIRNIVEIITYSKIRWVSGQPTFSFRAVAAQNDDPLREPYRGIIGALAANVRAGYLRKRGDQWSITPCRLPSEIGLQEKGGYLKVKERLILESRLPGYVELNSSAYLPQIHPVSFDAQVRADSRGSRFSAVTAIGLRSANLRYQGTLVCSGNMLETGRGNQRTRRKNQFLILEPAIGKEIPISHRAVEDYKLSLTPFQQEQLTAWGGRDWGCLRDGAPVFYVWTGREKEVVYFGHSPNFRVPVRLPGFDHAANPLDFVPENLRADELIDLTDALFGWTPEPGGKRKDSCAGRVFFGDGKLLGEPKNLWYRKEPVVPHVLSGPKATTFQHYLVQDRETGHEPDRKVSLAHYGTPRTETQIRGRKQYWHRGRDPQIEASEKEREHERQLTRIQPLNAGVRFRFRVNFENLRDEELGALLWALQPRGEDGKQYIHKLGMGKPLGMGAVEIDRLTLFLTDRQSRRYKRIFSESGGDWETGADLANPNTYKLAFEQFLLSRLRDLHSSLGRIADLPPLAELLEMMTWRGDDPDSGWLDWTRYMEIEHGTDKQNEFKERPVLPSPLEVPRWAAGQFSQSTSVERNAATVRRLPQQDEPYQPPLPRVRMPEKGDVLRGTVLDVEPDGTVYLDAIATDIKEVSTWLSEQQKNKEIVAQIHKKYLADKKLRASFREGSVKTIVVVVAQQDSSGWLIQCRPA